MNATMKNNTAFVSTLSTSLGKEAMNKFFDKKNYFDSIISTIQQSWWNGEVDNFEKKVITFLEGQMKKTDPQFVEAYFKSSFIKVLKFGVPTWGFFFPKWEEVFTRFCLVSIR